MNTISPELFEEVYQEHKYKLTSLVYHILKDHAATEDVVQETFRKLNIQDFDKIHDHINQWLYTVARNTAIKVYNKRGRFVPLDENYDQDMYDETPSVSEAMMSKELKKQLPKLMKVLTDKQKKVVRYKYYNDYSYEQIGKKLNISNGNVGFQLNFAINAMRKQFAKLNKKYQFV